MKFIQPEPGSVVVHGVPLDVPGSDVDHLRHWGTMVLLGLRVMGPGEPVETSVGVDLEDATFLRDAITSLLEKMSASIEDN